MVLDKFKSGLTNARTSMLSNLKSPKFLLSIFLVVLFIIIAVYVYRNYLSNIITPKYVANKEFIPQSEASKENKQADLYFFYTTWCPYCKKALPEWNKLKEKLQDGTIKGYKVNFYDVDCDKNKELADAQKIEGYPTIKLMVNGQTIEYDAKPNYDTLMQFLNSSL